MSWYNLMEHGFIRIEQIKSWKRENNRLIMQARTSGDIEATVEVEIFTSTVFRYRLYATNRYSTKRIDLTDETWSADRNLKLQIEENESQLQVYTDELCLRFQFSPWNLQVLNNDGEIIIEENNNDVDARGQLRSLPTGFCAQNGEIKKVHVNLRCYPEEHFYGLGEKFIDYDKKGWTIQCWNRNAYGTGTELAYKNIPFFISSRGYGLFLNSTFKSIFKFGSESNKSCSIDLDDSQLEYYFIYGPKFKNILKQYTQITGPASLPPIWSFGLWMAMAGDIQENQGQLMDFCHKIRSYRLPCDVININCNWMGTKGEYCTFKWGDNYPDPEALIQYLKKNGFHLVLWEHPYIKTDTEMFREGDRKGYFLKRKDGSTYIANLVLRPSGKEEYSEEFYNPGAIVDFTNPEAVEWYKEKHRRLLEMGVSAFKTDFGEEIPVDAIFYNGKTGREMHNAYPLLYNRTVFSIIKETTGQAVVWSRSAFAGSQKYPVNWSGDPQCGFDNMQETLRAGLSYGMSGVPFWTHDLGGFKGKPDKESYIRWVQFGLFSSHSRLFGTTPREPWAFDEETVSIIRDLVKLRYRLLPYIYSVAYEATQTGLPVIRPMNLEFQDDPVVSNIDHEYMFGPYLLVAPVFNKDNRVKIYLPEGKWFNFWTKQVYQGPKYLEITAPLNIIPLFVKAGAILPMGPEMQYVGEKPLNPLTLDIYPNRESRTVIRDYEKESNIDVFYQRVSPKKLELKIDNSDKDFIICFNQLSYPCFIEDKEGEIRRYYIEEDFQGAKKGWLYKESKDVLVVKTKVERSNSNNIVIYF